MILGIYGHFYQLDEVEKFKSVVGQQELIPSGETTENKKEYVIFDDGLSIGDELIGFELLLANPAIEYDKINIKVCYKKLLM